MKTSVFYSSLNYSKSNTHELHETHADQSYIVFFLILWVAFICLCLTYIVWKMCLRNSAVIDQETERNNFFQLESLTHEDSNEAMAENSTQTDVPIILTSRTD